MHHALLSLGYFPKELPPSFTTVGYAEAVTLECGGQAPPATFATARSAKLCPFSLARAGNFRFRRRLSIVNPIHYYNLSSVIASNWPALSTEIRSPLSRSTPVADITLNRAVTPSSTHGDLLPLKARNRSGSGAIVVADISEFYHSIYTHSIPWALYTKATAKANMRRRRVLLGDDIDRLVRKAQDDQTMGLPIGPDTSFILSELVLSACDRELMTRAPDLRGLRYFDDLEFPCPHSSSAESMLAVLQEVLLEYELRLNPRKTHIHMPPIEFESEWVRDIRAFVFRQTPGGQAGDLIGYFDLITKYMNKAPDEHIAKYAVTRLWNEWFVPQPSNLELYQSLLCQIATAEPGSIREILGCLIHITSEGCVLDSALISETLTAIVTRHAPLGHHYEVAWCIWAAIALNIGLDSASQLAISKVDNSVIAILALDAWKHNLAPELDTTLWEARQCQPELYDEQWLLSYEANVHGWLRSQGGGDHVSSDNNFGFLKSAGVRFYHSDPLLPIPHLPRGYGG